MNTAEWILVAILSITLFAFLVTGIILLCTNGIVTNIKGMTSIGGTMELFIDRYIVPKVRDKIKEVKENKERKERLEEEENGREEF